MKPPSAAPELDTLTLAELLRSEPMRLVEMHALAGLDRVVDEIRLLDDVEQVRSCRPGTFVVLQRSIARATINPPKKTKMTSWAYSPETSCPEAIPSVGKRTRGSREVTANGRTSVNQRVPTSIVTAAIRVTCGCPGIKSTNRKVKVAATTPKAAQIHRTREA